MCLFGSAQKRFRNTGSGTTLSGLPQTSKDIWRVVASSQAWKDFERRHARRFFNGKRILRGEDFSVSLPDGETAFEVWDCKHRQGIQAISWYREAQSKYATYTGTRRFHL